MRTGRPPSDERKRLPELEAIADWFVQAIKESGHVSIRRTAEMTGLNPRALYDAVNAERMLPLRRVRALAEGLGRDPEEITRLWAQAKQERDRAEEADRRRTQPSAATWADIPLPSPALRDLLEAQEGILDCLPYSLLDLAEPSLSAVYVRQTVRQRPADEPDDLAGKPAAAGPPSGGEDDAGHHLALQDGPAKPASRPARGSGAAQPSAVSPAVSLADALARYDHLLITGEAGAGKSTLTSHLARALCGVWSRRSTFQDAPVTEPLLPLHLPASSLVAEQGSWSERLRRAALSALGGMLGTDPPASLFNGRSQGTRWLVFVDGLDEVADRRQRADLIRTLARHSHRESDFRLVVTSRPLPPAELAPLRHALLGEFEIQPFGQNELRDYARRWFDQQADRVPHPAAAAERFVGDVVEKGELRELVRNPLLATLALVHATLEPSLPAPSSRLALYESFLARVRDRTHRGTSPFPPWLADSADELVRALARLRTEGHEDLAQDARTWIRNRPSPRVTPPPGWENDLPAALAGTGLLVVAGDQLRFLHQSFAEFLAAWEYAAEIPADGEGLEVWIRRASDGADRTLARFVLCRWADREDCSPELLHDRILSRPYPERPLLVASLMAEGVEMGEERATLLVKRLISLFRSDQDEYESAANALSALDGRQGQDTAPTLESLAGATELTAVQRLQALSALSRLTHPAVTARLLLPLLEVMYGLLPKAAQLALQLDGAARQAVRQRAVDLVAEPDADFWESAIAAETYRVLGAWEDLEQVARRTLEEPLARADELHRTAVARLGPDPAATAVAEVAALGHARPHHDHAGRQAVAAALEKAGALTEAAELAMTVVDSEYLTSTGLDAAGLCLRVRGTAAAEPACRLLARAEEAGWEYWRQGRLLQHMKDAGVGYPVWEWARDKLSGDNELPIGASEIIRLWLAEPGPDAGPADVLALVGRGSRLHLYDRAPYAKVLLDADLTEEAAKAAECTLRSPFTRDTDCRQAVEVLLRADRTRAVALLTALLDEGPVTSDWGDGALQALAADGMPDLDETMRRVAGRVLALPDAESAQIRPALLALMVFDGPEELERTVERACHHPGLIAAEQRGIAQAIASCGEEEAARSIWRHLLTVRGRPSEAGSIRILDDLAQSLGPDAARDLVREVLAAEPAPAPYQRRRLERLLTWLDTGPVRA